MVWVGHYRHDMTAGGEYDLAPAYVEALQAADHPLYGDDWEAWLAENSEAIADRVIEYARAPKYVGLLLTVATRGTVLYCGLDERDARAACEAAGGPGGTRVLPVHVHNVGAIEVGAIAHHDFEHAWCALAYDTPVTV